jgi:hypothetical protein
MRRRGAWAGSWVERLASVTAMSSVIRASGLRPSRKGCPTRAGTVADASISRRLPYARWCGAPPRTHRSPYDCPSPRGSHRRSIASPDGCPTRAGHRRHRLLVGFLQFSLQIHLPGTRMVERYLEDSRRSRQARTRVRIDSVRRPAYSTNTCSVCRTRQRSRGACWGRCAWFARSCCSRTTTRSTGRSIGTSLWSRGRTVLGSVEMNHWPMDIRIGRLYGAD